MNLIKLPPPHRHHTQYLSLVSWRCLMYLFFVISHPDRGREVFTIIFSVDTRACSLLLRYISFMRAVMGTHTLDVVGRSTMVAVKFLVNFLEKFAERGKMIFTVERSKDRRGYVDRSEVLPFFVLITCVSFLMMKINV